MAKGLTLEQLQNMGAKPVAPVAPKSGTGMSLQQLQNKGATPDDRAISAVDEHLNPKPNIFRSTLNNLVDSYKAAGQGTVNDIQQGADIASRGGLGNLARGALEGGLSAAGNTINAAFAPVGAIAKAVVPGEGLLGHIGQGAVAGAGLGTVIPGAGTLAGGLAGGVIGGGMYALQKGKDALKSNPTIAKFLMDNPDVEKDFDNALNVGLSVLGEKKVGEGLDANVKEVPGAIKTNLKDAGKTLVSPATKTLSAVRKILPEDVGTGKVSDIIGNAQNYLSKGNVEENFNTSIDRLAQRPIGPIKKGLRGPGAPGKYDPLAMYDEFAAQEDKYKSDIKKDQSTGVVGSRIGDAFDDVVRMRREAGKKMESEIQRVGNIKTDINQPVVELSSEFAKNGIKYDAKSKTWQPTKTSKVTSQDVSLLNEYEAQLRELGTEPTAAELDAFLSRTPKELDVYKSKNNIVKVTNGERIVKAHLDTLRNALDPKANPEFEAYSKAKADYAALSKFLEEGSSFLGKKTMSGDYKKDASLAKSAVSSLSNAGRKDWLLQLEDLTGYPALDEIILARQAAIDAGNPQPNNILNLLTPKAAGGSGGSIPTSAKGVVEKVVETGLDYGKRKLAGSPREQTRRLIIQRMKKGNEAAPSQFDPAELE